MAYIGIDLGTTYCAASYFIEGEAEMASFGDKETMPSVVSVSKRGKLLIGWEAKRNQAVRPHDTVLEIKRHMGKKQHLTKLGQKEFSPVEISSLILTKVKELAQESFGEEVDGVVITCPAYFDNPQREATRQAGELAGLNVIQVINEPTAAAHAYGVQEDSESEGLYLVYDLGGGTFDVTVIKKSGDLLEVIGTGGDPDLGGGDFDDRVVEWMIQHLEKIDGVAQVLEEEQKNKAIKIKLKSEAEKAKKALCENPPRAKYTFSALNILQVDGTAIHFKEELTMEKFNELIRPDLAKSLPWIDIALERPIKELNFTEADLTAVLLVGGSTRIPLVRTLLEERFPGKEIRGVESGINPDTIVAVGAGMLAAEKDPESEEDLESDLIDVTGHSLSIASFDPQKNEAVLTKIIEKETPIPVKEMYPFSTVEAFQENVQVEVYQGEHATNEPVKTAMGDGSRRITKIGSFNMRIKEPVGSLIPIEIGLSLDRNGILVATAVNKHSGEEIKVEISNVDKVAMDKSELDRKRAQLLEDLKAGVGTSLNPLDPPNNVSTTASPSRPAPTPQKTAAPAGDVKSQMNPVIRNMYEKVINNFGKIPDGDRLQVMQLLGEIEQAAQANDQAKLIGYYGALEQISQKVS